MKVRRSFFDLRCISKKVCRTFGAALWLAVLARPIGPLPALGPLLEIRSGIWNHRDFEWHSTAIPRLKSKVDVAIDQNGIPHIFASSEEDLYRTQGYIMASQRLFQMDLSTRAVTGRLSELVGARGLDIDRYFVKIGMRQSLMKSVNEYMADAHMAMMMNAFTDGVNSFIRGLQDLPAEYKILGTRPQPFDVSQVLAMSRALTFNLNGRSEDLVMSHLAQQIGFEKVLDLFPEFMPQELSDYVLPGPWSKTRRKPETADLFTFKTHIQNFPAIPKPSKGNGSNNWVIAPSKSATGHSILANDTHLGFSLPGIWFENQLVCPEFNVYGVSLPDIPGIIAGFNGPVAWGPTNGGTDAADYVEVEFTGEDSNKYLSHGAEKEAQIFKETISSTDGTSETMDVVWTDWGPLLHREGRYGIAYNWTSYQPKSELRAVRRLYDVKSAKACLEAFDDWNVPIQNFVCADADHIGIRHAGFIPKREVGEGRFVGKAGESRYDLHVPVEKNLIPMRVDPKEGYLRSANQRVVDETYPNYMGWDYEEPFRGMRIRKMIESKPKLTGEDVIAIQNDSYDMQAEMALPILLFAVMRDGFTPDQLEALKLLEKWDYVARAESTEPALYRAWFASLKHEIFDDEYDLPEAKNFEPQDIRVIWMLKRVQKNPNDSDNQWIDDKRTPQKEILPQIVTRAFQSAWKHNREKLGNDPKKWTWKRAINTRVDHIAKLPGFGSPLLAMDGAPSSVRSNRGWHGPVYKFVIELGDNGRAWMQTPGGASGDPFSPLFEQNVQDWAAGKMRQIKRYKDLAEARAEGLKIYDYVPEN